jgi:hypothetical protein
MQIENERERETLRRRKVEAKLAKPRGRRFEDGGGDTPAEPQGGAGRVQAVAVNVRRPPVCLPSNYFSPIDKPSSDDKPNPLLMTYQTLSDDKPNCFVPAVCPVRPTPRTHEEDLRGRALAQHDGRDIPGVLRAVRWGGAR